MSIEKGKKQQDGDEKSTPGSGQPQPTQAGPSGRQEPPPPQQQQKKQQQHQQPKPGPSGQQKHEKGTRGIGKYVNTN